MEIFTEAGAALLARWVHILAGITWIGLLYYFNFVQGPFFAQTAPEVKGAATRQLVPRALWWFRYSALVTLVAGVVLILININAGFGSVGDFLKSPYGLLITSGMGLGTLMFLNVWGVIWPNQKIVIASAEATASGGSADPRAADAGRRAFLASRTNVVFSIPMLFFMASATHLPRIGNAETKIVFVLIAVVLTGALELNALSGLTGSSKKPLEKINTTIVTGFAFWAILYGVLEILKLD